MVILLLGNEFHLLHEILVGQLIRVSLSFWPSISAHGRRPSFHFLSPRNLNHERRTPDWSWWRIQCLLGSFPPGGRLVFPSVKDLISSQLWSDQVSHLWFLWLTKNPKWYFMFAPDAGDSFSAATSWYVYPAPDKELRECYFTFRIMLPLPGPDGGYVSIPWLPRVSLPKNRPQVVGDCDFGVVELGRITFAE